MKGKWTALVMAMAAVCLAVTGGLAAKVLFEDKFATLDPAWGVPSAILSANDGKLIITPAKNYTSTYLYQGNVFPNDMEASYIMTFVEAGEPTYGSGLLFWAKDYTEYYCLLINANGWFAVQQLVDGRYLMPVAWCESDAIWKGEGRENQVKVVTKGNQATVFVNEKEVVHFDGQPPGGGSLIGFKVGSGPYDPNSVAFSNFQVVQP